LSKNIWQLSRTFLLRLLGVFAALSMHYQQLERPRMSLGAMVSRKPRTTTRAIEHAKTPHSRRCSYIHRHSEHRPPVLFQVHFQRHSKWLKTHTPEDITTVAVLGHVPKPAISTSAPTFSRWFRTKDIHGTGNSCMSNVRGT
jgi:hypothetical protein